MELITHHIDGEDVESESAARFDSVDPYTQSAYAEVALGGQAEVDRAVASARRAFDEGPWPRMGPAERGALLHRLPGPPPPPAPARRAPPQAGGPRRRARPGARARRRHRHGQADQRRPDPRRASHRPEPPV